jgi:hypothetical protein
MKEAATRFCFIIIALAGLWLACEVARWAGMM